MKCLVVLQHLGQDLKKQPENTFTMQEPVPNLEFISGNRLSGEQSGRINLKKHFLPPNSTNALFIKAGDFFYYLWISGLLCSKDCFSEHLVPCRQICTIFLHCSINYSEYLIPAKPQQNQRAKNIKDKLPLHNLFHCLVELHRESEAPSILDLN